MNKLLLVSIGLIAVLPLRVTHAQTVVPPTATPLPASSPSPPTVTVDERVSILENQVAQLSAKSTASQVKEIVDIVQGVVTLAAIVISGTWGYWLFVQNRQRYPRARLTHRITHKVIDDKVLLHVTVTGNNIGNIMISVVNAETRIQQMLPLPAELVELVRQGHKPVREGQTEVDYWPLLDIHEVSLLPGEYEIEPGESQDFDHDFLVGAEIEAIIVYSHFKNESKHDRQLGWDLTTMYDLKRIASQRTEE